MADVLTDACWVLMPPEFEYLGGIILPDLRRARLAARLALAVEAWQARGRRVFFEPGAGGRTARQVAEALAASGAREAFVAGTGHDRTGAGILCEAFGEARIPCEGFLLSQGEGEDILRRLTARVEARTVEGASLTEDPPKGRAPGGFMILEEGDPIPRQGAAFRNSTDGLERASTGPAGSICPSVNSIRLIRPDDKASWKAIRRTGVLTALCLPLGGEEGQGKMPPWLAPCRSLIESAGPEGFRLSIAQAESGAGIRMKDAAWAARCGLQSARFRDFLLELVARHLPDRLGLLQAVLGFRAVCADPLEEMYAGCSLPDRNQCLIENIVP